MASQRAKLNILSSVNIDGSGTRRLLGLLVYRLKARLVRFLTNPEPTTTRLLCAWLFFFLLKKLYQTWHYFEMYGLRLHPFLGRGFEIH